MVVLEEGSYEKDVLMYINLGVPQMVGGRCSFLTRSLLWHSLINFGGGFRARWTDSKDGG